MPALLDTRRTAAALVAVAMSAALITLALVVSGSMRTQMQAGARLSVGGADVVVASHRGSDPAQGPLDDALVARVSALDGVASVRGTHWEVIELDLPSQLKGAVGATLAAQDVPALSAYTTLTAGRLPAAAGEVAIDSTLAEQQGLGVGDTIRLRSRSEDRHDSSTGSTDGVVHSSPTVVGVISPGADTGLEGISKVYATADQLAAMGVRTDYDRLYVTGRPGTDTSDLHEEVARVVHAVQSDAIVQDADEVIARRAVSFTGSTQVGRTLMRQAADKVLVSSMELGGNAPFIVAPDADLDAAVAGAMQAKFRGTGEACTAANRFYVHTDVHDAFVERLARAVRALRVGPALGPEGCEIGPLVTVRARDAISALVERAVVAGARVSARSACPAGPGAFLPATVLAGVAPDAEIVRTEIFGPVAPVVAWEDEEQMLGWANGTDAGLAAYVFSEDLRWAMRLAERLEFGMVGINRGLVSDPAAPFGGLKESGIGREGAREGVREFQETQYWSIAWD